MMSDVIRLTGLRFDGIHGVHEHERLKAQPFLVDVALWLDTSTAGRSDDLADTVDYSAVVRDVADVITGPARNLIETLAEDIARRLLARYAFGRIDVTVHKPAAEVGVDCVDISVTITRERPDA